MDDPQGPRNPIVILGAAMILGIGGLILIVGLVSGGGSLPAVLVGGVIVTGGLVLLAAGRRGGDTGIEEDEE